MVPTSIQVHLAVKCSYCGKTLPKGSAAVWVSNSKTAGIFHSRCFEAMQDGITFLSKDFKCRLKWVTVLNEKTHFNEKIHRTHIQYKTGRINLEISEQNNGLFQIGMEITGRFTGSIETRTSGTRTLRCSLKTAKKNARKMAKHGHQIMVMFDEMEQL